MDEATFWRRMNPARLHRLLDARFGARREAQEAEEPKSLSQYLMGG